MYAVYVFSFFSVVRSQKEKSAYVCLRRKKAQNYDGGNVVSIVFIGQLIEIQKLCPINIQMSKKVEKRVTEKLKKQNVKSEAFFPQPRNEIFIKCCKKVSQQ